MSTSPGTRFRGKTLRKANAVLATLRDQTRVAGCLCAAIALLAGSPSLAADLPVGQIIDKVTCGTDASQSYTLYLPSAYKPDRVWPVIYAFDPGGRGRNGVERYQAAAEQYGFIVAGSNNSRNGEDPRPAISAMTRDVAERFKIDPKRMYTAGMSGGSRVALALALEVGKIAGVIASSAGYPDGVRRKTLRFPVFATAGTEDFNHLEMRRFDSDLTTPHHLVIFEGGHVWLSSALALEAVEWMEIQAMKSGLKPRDEKEIDQIFAKRMAAVGSGRDKHAFLELQSMAADFEGLRDVKALAARANDLGQDKGVRDALQKDRDEDDREVQMMNDVAWAEDALDRFEDHAEALVTLRQRWQQLSEQAKKPEDSTERRLARRVLSSLSAGTQTTDQEYLNIINEFRLSRGRR